MCFVSESQGILASLFNLITEKIMPQHELNEWNQTNINNMSQVDPNCRKLRDANGMGSIHPQASYCRYVVHAVAPIWVGFPNMSQRISERNGIMTNFEVPNCHDLLDNC